MNISTPLTDLRRGTASAGSSFPSLPTGPKKCPSGQRRRGWCMLVHATHHVSMGQTPCRKPTDEWNISNYMNIYGLWVMNMGYNSTWLIFSSNIWELLTWVINMGYKPATSNRMYIQVITQKETNRKFLGAKCSWDHFWSHSPQFLVTHIRYLVGGLEHFLFSPIVGMMIQSDEVIFFRGVGWNHQPVILRAYWELISGAWNPVGSLDDFGVKLRIPWALPQSFLAKHPGWVQTLDHLAKFGESNDCTLYIYMVGLDNRRSRCPKKVEQFGNKGVFKGSEFLTKLVHWVLSSKNAAVFQKTVLRPGKHM